MSRINSYYVIAPIDGLRMDFDYRLYSAELYGCPPDYKPKPELCAEFRQPWEILGKIPFHGYDRLIPQLITDVLTIDTLPSLPDRKMSDFTCIGFQIDFDQTVNPFDDSEESSQRLFNLVIEQGESLLDPLRFCIFKPGADESIGRFGSAGNGIQCFWIGNNEVNLKFFARRSIRFALIQKPLDILESEFGLIYSDIAFQGLCQTAFEKPIDRSYFYGYVLRALVALRESRDIQSPEARFRHLTAIAEDLAKIEEDERLAGIELRNRIAKISAQGWDLYKYFIRENPRTMRLNSENYKLQEKRLEDLGWKDENEAKSVIRDLWSNVRNPLSHSLATFQTLERDFRKDISNMERVVITMINGWYAAYEMEGRIDEPAYLILLNGNESGDDL